MEQQAIEVVVRDIDVRLRRVEQILPTLATQEGVRNSIAEAVKPLATKTAVEATIAEAVKPLATKAELERFATKEDLKQFATKVELADGLVQLERKLRTEMREEGERTRHHFDVVAEQIADRFRFLADGHIALGERLDRRVDTVAADVTRLDLRVTKVEARKRPK